MVDFLPAGHETDLWSLMESSSGGVALLTAGRVLLAQLPHDVPGSLAGVLNQSGILRVQRRRWWCGGRLRRW